MKTLRLTVILLSLLAIIWPAGAVVCSSGDDQAQNDSLVVSLLTCYPGPEVYQLYGHSAIRIRQTKMGGERLDSVWNYGLFNFRAPNFVYRFVKGETDYMVGGYPIIYFLDEYENRGSKVVEQDLNLTQPEARKLRALLQTESLPENRTYRYNYVKDNCSTRIIERIDDALAAPVSYPDTMSHPTFRKEMRAYDHTYPWYALGIDIALGSGLDYKLTGREDMFVPLELMRKAENARLQDGRKLVSAQRVLVQGVPSAIEAPTPWYLTPLFCFLLVMVFSALVCAWDLRKNRITRWWYTVYFFISGVAGLLVTFLVFFSEHEATSPNLLIWWLNPIGLLAALLIWMPKMKPVVAAIMIFEILAVGVMLLCWPFQRQSTNPALFPLMLATLMLAITYTVLALRKPAASRPARGATKPGGKKVKIVRTKK